MGSTPEAFADVFDHLERHGIRYVVISGVAVVLHGHVRPVVDLDLAIDPEPEAANLAMRALMGLGFMPSIPLPLTAVTLLRMFDGAGREVDVFVRHHVPFAELWADSHHVPVGSGEARVASREHVLRAKRITGRPPRPF